MSLAKSFYCESTLKKYSKFYPKDQILIGFYDVINDNPEKSLSDIVEFLGGNVSEISTNCNLTKKIMFLLI